MLILNPAILYSLIWTFILIIYSLQLSNILQPLKPETILLVIGSSLTFLFGWLFESFFRGGWVAKPKIDLDFLNVQLKKTCFKPQLTLIASLFIILISLEVIIFGGLPFFSIFGIGSGINYSEFGIPGLHGFINSLFYVFCTLFFVINLLKAIPLGNYLIFFISITYPLFVMSRQLFISLMIQYFILYLFVRRPSFLNMFKIAFLFFIILLIFGYVGDFRSGRDHIIALANPTFDYPEWLPSAFIWIYIYLCTPINNVNFNIGVTPNYFPFETMSSFIPSFFREFLLNSVRDSNDWTLFTESFNANSLLRSLISDFGIIGSLFFTFFLGYFLTVLMRSARNNLSDLFTITILTHAIALSFFENLLFHLVFMFQILIIRLVLKNKFIIRL